MSHVSLFWVNECTLVSFFLYNFKSIWVKLLFRDGFG